MQGQGRSFKDRVGAVQHLFSQHRRITQCCVCSAIFGVLAKTSTHIFVTFYLSPFRSFVCVEGGLSTHASLVERGNIYLFYGHFTE